MLGLDFSGRTGARGEAANAAGSVVRKEQLDVYAYYWHSSRRLLIPPAGSLSRAGRCARAVKGTLQNDRLTIVTLWSAPIKVSIRDGRRDSGRDARPRYGTVTMLRAQHFDPRTIANLGRFPQPYIVGMTHVRRNQRGN